jgi:hypothetical protein
MSFDFRSRLTWIGRTDSGVVRQRLYDRGIHGVGLSLLDPGAKTWAAAVRKEAPAFPFFYYDPHWDGLAADGSALKARQRIDSLLVGVGALPGELLMLDLELVSAEYERRLLFGSSGNRGLFGSNNPERTDRHAGGQAVRLHERAVPEPHGGRHAGDLRRRRPLVQPGLLRRHVAGRSVGGSARDRPRHGGRCRGADVRARRRTGASLLRRPADRERPAGRLLLHRGADTGRVRGTHRGASLSSRRRFTKDALRTHYRELAQKQAAA